MGGADANSTVALERLEQFISVAARGASQCHHRTTQAKHLTTWECLEPLWTCWNHCSCLTTAIHHISEGLWQGILLQEIPASAITAAQASVWPPEAA